MKTLAKRLSKLTLREVETELILLVSKTRQECAQIAEDAITSIGIPKENPMILRIFRAIERGKE